jgi:hypothetical protein
MYLFLGAEQLGADQHGTDRERTEGLELGTISDFSEHRVEYRIETVGNTISLIRPSVFLNQEPTGLQLQLRQLHNHRHHQPNVKKSCRAKENPPSWKDHKLKL